MTEVLPNNRIYRPSRSAGIVYMWDITLFLTGLSLLVFRRESVVAIILGIVTCLFALWQYVVSRCVLRTHFLVTDEGIALVGPHYSSSIQWNEIAQVVIRERPTGIQVCRADRLVVLIDHAGRKLPLNTSVLPADQETRLLDDIKSRVRCPIQKVTDGHVLPSRLRKAQDL